MNTRLSQDALEVMQWHEFQQAERARWARAQPPKIVGRMWFPPLTEQERQDREKQVTDGLIPF